MEGFKVPEDGEQGGHCVGVSGGCANCSKSWKAAASSMISECTWQEVNTMDSEHHVHMAI